MIYDLRSSTRKSSRESFCSQVAGRRSKKHPPCWLPESQGRPRCLVIGAAVISFLGERELGVVKAQLMAGACSRTMASAVASRRASR